MIQGDAPSFKEHQTVARSVCSQFASQLNVLTALQKFGHVFQTWCKAVHEYSIEVCGSQTQARVGTTRHKNHCPLGGPADAKLLRSMSEISFPGYHSDLPGAGNIEICMWMSVAAGPNVIGKAKLMFDCAGMPRFNNSVNHVLIKSCLLCAASITCPSTCRANWRKEIDSASCSK